MEWRAEYGSIRKSLLWLDFTDCLTGAKRKLKKAELLPDAQTRIRALPREFKGWLLLSPQHKVEYADCAADLPESLLASALSAAAQHIRRWDPDAAKSEDMTVLLRELLSDSRITDQEKLSLLLVPWVIRHHGPFMAALDHRMYPLLRAALRIDEQWIDINQDVPQEVTALSEWLLEPAEVVDIKKRREHAKEEKRLLEEQERRRQEEEREKERIEQERQARIRGERTESLRRALAAGRGQADPSELVVTEEFQTAFDIVEKGTKLLFVTGKPGTGKSTLIQALRLRLSSRNLAVLSFTGTAALNVGGQTINSFFAMPHHILELDWTNDSWSFKQRAQALEIMIVDEGSMLRPDMMDAMDSSLRKARRDPRPFGGVQVVLVGDLYQLPPVLENQAAVREYYARVYGEGRYFIAAKVIQQAKPLLIELTRVFRQRQTAFLEFLSKIREASITGEELDAFNDYARRQPDFKANEFHLIVTPRRAVASSFNKAQLDMLPGDPKSYQSQFEGNVEQRNQVHAESPNKYPADLLLELKPSAQVIFVKNDDGKHWVNGDLGIVEELSDDWIKVTTWSGTWRVERAEWPLVRYEIDPDTHRLVPFEYGKFIQFPLRLAWAATIHKMQGQTVDRIKIDLTGGAFETGMTYVALSRCRTMEGIRLTRPLVLADVVVDSTIEPYLGQLPRHDGHQGATLS